jgi:hypothetical protein
LGILDYHDDDVEYAVGNPVIAVISLPDGGYHFMVIVGKEGRD